MTAIMEEMKHQSQAILENFREKGQSRQEVVSKPERHFSNELRGQHSENLHEAGEFHRSPMQAEVIYIPPHRREGGTLENVAWERPNVARVIAPQRIFAHTNLITQLGAYEKGFSFSRGLGGIMYPTEGVIGN